MTLPTPNYQFFTTNNVLYDAISMTNKLSQNSAINQVISENLIVAGKDVIGAYFPGTGSHSVSSSLLPQGNDAGIYANGVLCNPSTTISFWCYWTGTTGATGPVIFQEGGTTTSQRKIFIRPYTIPQIIYGRNGSTPPSTRVNSNLRNSLTLVVYTIQTSNLPVQKVYENTTKIYDSGIDTYVPNIPLQTIWGLLSATNQGSTFHMYDFRIYNDSFFSDSQVTELYNSYFIENVVPKITFGNGEQNMKFGVNSTKLVVGGA